MPVQSGFQVVSLAAHLPVLVAGDGGAAVRRPGPGQPHLAVAEAGCQAPRRVGRCQSGQAGGHPLAVQPRPDDPAGQRSLPVFRPPDALVDIGLDDVIVVEQDIAPRERIRLTAHAQHQGGAVRRRQTRGGLDEQLDHHPGRGGSPVQKVDRVADAAELERVGPQGAPGHRPVVPCVGLIGTCLPVGAEKHPSHRHFRAPDVGRFALLQHGVDHRRRVVVGDRHLRPLHGQAGDRADHHHRLGRLMAETVIQVFVQRRQGQRRRAAGLVRGDGQRRGAGRVVVVLRRRALAH